MRNTLYRQMVYCINAYRTWIEVADDNLYKENIISRTDRTDYLVSRTLVLRADAETIIRLATYGTVQLELMVRPIHIPEKPYYLCY